MRFNSRDLDLPKFSRECFAYQKAREVGVKVPNIVSYERLDGVEILILEKASGETIASQWTENKNRDQIIENVCKQLRSIHKISVPRFGFYGKGEPSFEFWDDFNFTRLKKHMIKCQENEIVLDEQIILEYYESKRNVLRDFKSPKLVHNDFHLGNILYQNEVTAVLDWEWSMGGDPLIDFQCVQDWHYDWPGAKEIMFKAYGIEWPLTGADKLRFDAYDVISTIEMLWVTKKHFLKFEWGQQQYEDKQKKLKFLIS